MNSYMNLSDDLTEQELADTTNERRAQVHRHNTRGDDHSCWFCTDPKRQAYEQEAANAAFERAMNAWRHDVTDMRVKAQNGWGR